ncbi:N/A [soil metagenome]
MVSVRRLGVGDERVVRLLAEDDADFGLEESSDAAEPLDDVAAAAYLADPSVVHWIASVGDEVVGHLFCLVERRRSMPARQLLLYDIGVRAGHRRAGVGRALIDEMTSWMSREGIGEVWVVADGEAVAFYQNLGFGVSEGELVPMDRRVGD